VVVMMVVAMVMVPGGKDGSGKHQDEQGSREDFLHGLTVAPGVFEG
jgi:hypothetical protein